MSILATGARTAADARNPAPHPAGGGGGTRPRRIHMLGRGHENQVSQARRRG